ncbi:MAG: hypothetical protein FIA89_03030 [Geobacter sp.]|nr:hypothetical protein [Geobacter sp.]
MKAIASLLFAILTFIAIPEAKAYLLMIYLDSKEYSTYGDFIIYNNTPYNITWQNKGWPHPDIFKYPLGPYSTAIDTSCYIKGGSEDGGRILFSPAVAGVTGFQLHSYVKNTQTYWEMMLLSSAATAPAQVTNGQLFAPPPVITKDSNMIQLVDGPLVYTLLVSFNRDSTSLSNTGHTKLILTISEWKSTDFSQFQTPW